MKKIKSDPAWNFYIGEIFRKYEEQGYTYLEVMQMIRNNMEEVKSSYQSWLASMRKFEEEERKEKSKRQEKIQLLRAKNNYMTARTRNVLANSHTPNRYEVPLKRR